MPEVIVNGLAQLQRDLRKSGPLVGRAMREGLRVSAEPVAHLAEELALSRIKRMPRSPQWAVNRIGVLSSGVYIAPRQRGVKSGNPYDPRRRPNLVELMMGRSYEPALEAGSAVVERNVYSLIGEVTGQIGAGL